MIDPSNITNFNLTDDQLEEHILFWVFAAGHSGRGAAKKINQVLNEARISFEEDHPNEVCPTSPFELLDKVDLTYVLGMANSFNPERMFKTIPQLIAAKLNLRTCSREELCKIYGIKMKTASCFIMHSRPNVRMAGLDRHILRFLRDRGVDAPQSTPSIKKYLELEEIYLNICDVEERNPAQFDLEIWNKKA